MRIVYALVVALFIVATGCGDEFEEDKLCEDVACHEDPWCCPGGQTCGSDSQTTFACINVGSGEEGSPCQKYIGNPGCGELLYCFTAGGGPDGVCTRYCNPSDPDRSCPNYRNCMTVTVNQSTTIHVCDPNPPPS